MKDDRISAKDNSRALLGGSTDLNLTQPGIRFEPPSNVHARCSMKAAKMSKLFAILILTGVFLPGRSAANLTYYTDPAAWRAAVGFYLTEPFDSSGLRTFTSVDTIYGGIGTAGGALQGSVWKDNVFEHDFGYSQTSFSSSAGLLFGAAAYFDPLGNAGGLGLKITLDWSLEQVATVYPGLGGFIGWTSTRPFNSFLLSTDYRQFGGGVTFDMDNLEFAPVPEPSCIVLMLLGVLVRMRRLNRA